jgi:steroid delta-isomerase-like uncharacterized protein
MQTLRLKDGKYEEHWGGISMLSLMNQLGFLDVLFGQKAEAQAKDLARKYVEAINTDDFDLLAETIADDFQDEAAAPGFAQGLEGAKQAHQMLRGAFSDLVFTVQDVMAEHDKVVLRVSARGTHTGSFFGVEPTGKEVSWTGMRIFRVGPDGKFASGISEFDQVGIMQQLGVIPSLAPPPDLEGNKAIIQKLYDEENKGNIDAIDELMDPNVVIYGDAMAPLVKGTASIKEQVKAVKVAFPDLIVTIEEIAADGDKVMTRLRWTGTQTGDFMGLPASNKEMSWTAIGINRIENGKVVERWFNASTLSLLQQFGLVPS